MLTCELQRKEVVFPQGGVLGRDAFNCSVSVPESHRLPLLDEIEKILAEDSTGLCSSLACLLFTEFVGTWCTLWLIQFFSSIPTTQEAYGSSTF